MIIYYAMLETDGVLQECTARSTLQKAESFAELLYDCLDPDDQLESTSWVEARESMNGFLMPEPYWRQSYPDRERKMTRLQRESRPLNED